MRRFLQKLLTKPVVILANKLSSRPDKRRVDKALSRTLSKHNNQPR